MKNVEEFLEVVYDGVEPSLFGPFEDVAALEREMLRRYEIISNTHSDSISREDDSVFQLRIINGSPYIYPFSGGYIENLIEHVQAKREKRAPKYDRSFPMHTVVFTDKNSE